MKTAVILFCRPGYEATCAQEVTDHLVEAGVPDSKTRLQAQKGLVFCEVPEVRPDELRKVLKLSQLIFTRQLLWNAVALEKLPQKGKAEPVAAAIGTMFRNTDPLYLNLRITSPDFDPGDDLKKFCKKFQQPLENSLKKSGFKKVYSRKDLPDIVVCFTDYETAWVSLSHPGDSSPHDGGIIRLKFPKDAPSRSTLKLEEAFHQFMPGGAWEAFLQPDKKATDLGACPGGWTWQFVSRGIHVTAVDHGKIDNRLMKTGLVDHLEEDAFTFKPRKRTDILVCDVADRPSKVAAMLTRWMHNQLSDMIICNLKLPMKKKYEEVQKCLEIFRHQGAVRDKDILLAKHLYHNRDEVTVFWHRPGPKPSRSKARPKKKR